MIQDSKWIKAGELPARDDAWKHTVTLPGWAWVDPEKEGKANMLALDGGWTDIATITAGIGFSVGGWGLHSPRGGRRF